VQQIKLAIRQLLGGCELYCIATYRIV